MRKAHNFKDITGQKFNRLLVLNRVENDKWGQTLWLCKCDCGGYRVVRGTDLKRNNTKSCGCLHKEGNHKTHGKSHTRLYIVWQDIKQRCQNSKVPCFSYYGEEGKTVCDEWLHDFQAFYDWSMVNGYQENLEIDRIDNTKGYSPENCRWATRKEQSNNTRRNHIIEYKGKKQNLTQWAEELNINYNKLLVRIKRYNWSTERAFTTP